MAQRYKTEDSQCFKSNGAEEGRKMIELEDFDKVEMRAGTKAGSLFGCPSLFMRFEASSGDFLSRAPGRPHSSAKSVSMATCNS